MPGGLACKCWENSAHVGSLHSCSFFPELLIAASATTPLSCLAECTSDITTQACPMLISAGIVDANVLPDFDFILKRV